MKVKRYKQARKILSFFKINFNFREPIQVIVDGTFCQAALQGRVNIKDQLPKYLGCQLHILTTKCVLNELASQRVLGGAHYIAKHLQVRQCHHSKPLSPDECIQAMLGPDNTNHYCIATQDSTIQKVLRKRGNIPLIHIIRNTVVLEEPSDCSHDEVEKLTNEKTMPSEHECIDKQLTELGVHDECNKVKKRKRPQGPNPLSVKKKKRMTIPNKSGGVSMKNKGRRLRLQKRRAIEHLISKIETN